MIRKMILSGCGFIVLIGFCIGICGSVCAGTNLEDMIVEAVNPHPDKLPTLGLWQRGEETLVSVTFPILPVIRGVMNQLWISSVPRLLKAAE